MKAIASLDFEEKPDYSYLKSLFGAKEDRKSKFHFDSENQIGSLEHSKGPCLRERIPCKPVNGEIRITRNTKLPKEREEFSWERILAGHPEKMAKTFLNHPSPLTPPPSPTPPSFPTYAMLRVIQRMKDKHPEKPIRHKTNGKTSEWVSSKIFSTQETLIIKFNVWITLSVYLFFAVTSGRERVWPQQWKRLLNCERKQCKYHKSWLYLPVILLALDLRDLAQPSCYVSKHDKFIQQIFKQL